MRTTLDLAPDLLATLRSLARERGTTLTEVVDATLRAGLTHPGVSATPYRAPTHPLSLRPGLDLEHALAVAAALEDDEMVRPPRSAREDRR